MSKNEDLNTKMDTITRTFPIEFTNTYSANSIIEFCHFRDMAFEADERVSVYLESFFCNLNLKSFLLGIIPDFDGDESEAEKMAKFSAAEAKSQKVGLRILTRKNNAGNWAESAEIILINRGRKDYFDLLQPYLAKNQVAILEKNDALAIQLIDYGNGLLKEEDSLRIVSGVTVTISKKNDVEALQARISALELALEGKLTNLPSDSLLGRGANTGTVEIIAQSKFVVEPRVIELIESLGGGEIDLSSVEQLLESNFKSKFFIESHYLSLAGGGNFPASGANGGFCFTIAEIGHPGIAVLSTGSNSTGAATAVTGMSNNASGIILDDGPITYFAIIKIPVLRDTINDYVIDLGFQSAGASVGFDACCFSYSANNPNWEIHTRSSGDYSIIATGVPVIASQWLEMRITVADEIALFAIDGIDVLTTSQKLPLSPRMVGVGVDIRKISGSVGRDVWIDYQSAKQIFLNAT